MPPGAWGAVQGPVCCSPGPTLRMEQNTVLILIPSAGQLGRVQLRRGSCAGMSDLTVPGERTGTGSAAPRAAAPDLAQPHLNYFQAASRSLRSPRSCRQAASRGSVLAGF